MDLASVTPEGIMAQNTSLALGALGMKVERKLLDLAQANGSDMARLIDSAGGVGNTINTYA